MADSQYILEVNNLCQHFSSGRGKKKLTVKAVDDVTSASVLRDLRSGW